MKAKEFDKLLIGLLKTPKMKNKTTPTAGERTDAIPGTLPEMLWRDDDGFIAQGTGDTYITFADTNVNDDDIDDRERRTEQLISAYNNTYGKGINPNAFPLLVEALKTAANRIAYCIELNEMPEDATAMLRGEIDAINEAIEKANQ